MILDNEKRKVHEWIEKHSEAGALQLVTGYFTIGALAWMSEKLNEKITRFDLVLGEMSGHDASRDRTIDLLNERISLDSAIQNLHAVWTHPDSPVCHRLALMRVRSADVLGVILGEK